MGSSSSYNSEHLILLANLICQVQKAHTLFSSKRVLEIGWENSLRAGFQLFYSSKGHGHWADCLLYVINSSHLSWKLVHVPSTLNFGRPNSLLFYNSDTSTSAGLHFSSLWSHPQQTAKLQKRAPTRSLLSLGSMGTVCLIHVLGPSGQECLWRGCPVLSQGCLVLGSWSPALWKLSLESWQRAERPFNFKYWQVSELRLKKKRERRVGNVPRGLRTI